MPLWDRCAGWRAVRGAAARVSVNDVVDSAGNTYLEAEIQQQQVKGVSAQHLVSRLAIMDPINGEAVPLEAGTDRLTDHGIIFY